MLKWALVFAFIAVLAGVLEFTGIAAGTGSIAKILFVLFLLMFVVIVLIGLFGVKALGKK
ncbi:MAG TPA: DUF1328 domain-containing protein [Rhizobacter sp.]|nr:DUF1328 domain-containing protein [Rhizobacter sp.]